MTLFFSLFVKQSCFYLNYLVSGILHPGTLRGRKRTSYKECCWRGRQQQSDAGCQINAKVINDIVF